ncbi:MAG: hypothetical protein EOO22_27640, partial [Comamonadaceae bacterium]
QERAESLHILRPEARPQDVQAFRTPLNDGLAADSPLRLPTPKTAPAPYQAEVKPAPEALQPEPEDAAVDAPPAQTAFIDTHIHVDATPTTPNTLQPSEAPRRRQRGWLAGGLIALCVLAAGTAYWWPAGSSAPASASAPSPISVPQAPAKAEAPEAPAQAAASTPTPTPTPTLTPTPTPIPTPMPTATPTATPKPTEPVTAKAPASKPATKGQRDPAVATLKPARETVQDSTAAATPEAAPSYSERSRPPRCGELILKASLETLTPDELSFLKSKCR